MARKNASGANQPQEAPEEQPEQSLGDEISLDELASLLGDQADYQRSATPEPEPVAESLGDEISLEELAALQVAAGGKLGTPATSNPPSVSQSPAPAPASPPLPTPTPPAPTPQVAQPSAFGPMAPVPEGENIDTSMSLLMD